MNVQEMAVKNTQVFQSRWGYHPCDRGLFLKLKEIMKYHWQARRMLAEWERWYRKEPQNRVIRKWIKDDNGRKCGYEVVGPKPEPKTCPLFKYKDRWGQVSFGGEAFLADYQNARNPKAQEDVKPLTHTIAQIDQLLAQCREWFISG